MTDRAPSAIWQEGDFMTDGKTTDGRIPPSPDAALTGEAPGAPAERHRQMGGLGLAMVLLLGVQAAVLSVAAWMEFGLAAQPSPAPSEIEDSLNMIDGLLFVQLLLFMPLAVMFIVWAWSGVKNLEAMGQQPRRSSGGRSAAG